MLSGHAHSQGELLGKKTYCERFLKILSYLLSLILDEMNDESVGYGEDVEDLVVPVL